MSAPAAPPRTRESALRRLAYGVLLLAVRGRRDRGGDWGEAVLAEFGETRGDWAAVRWAAGGLLAVWHERRGRVRQLPRAVRIRRRVVLTLVLGILAGLAVNRYVLTVDQMYSGSMEPTLWIGDRYLEDKVGYRLIGLHHGDVVVVAVGDGSGARSVKRVIGLPGDTIECRDGHVWRNGSQLDEPYLEEPHSDEDRTDCATVVVPPHRLYLLGDHRALSRDSRQNGPVDQDTVEARMLTRVWPLGN